MKSRRSLAPNRAAIVIAAPSELVTCRRQRHGARFRWSGAEPAILRRGRRPARDPDCSIPSASAVAGIRMSTRRVTPAAWPLGTVASAIVLIRCRDAESRWWQPGAAARSARKMIWQAIVLFVVFDVGYKARPAALVVGTLLVFGSVQH